MREIKFRGFHNNEEMKYFGLGQSIPDGEIMQFSGLKDKNGTEIYEGDIVIYLDARGEVYYCSDNCMFMVGFKQNCSSWSFDSMDGEIEVIGNIYENPKLIK